MRLYLEIIEGPSEGRKLSLSKSTTIGRKGADILLNDPKLSGIHAIFQYEESGGWAIIDNDSRNGIWVNGLKEIRMVLQDSDEIVIGSSKMLCRLVEGSSFKFSEKFSGWVQKLFKSSKNEAPSHLSEIKPEIRLKVIQGIQYGETWDINYGPRQAGKENNDICLYEDVAPEESFEIRVKGKYAYFYTEREKIVKLNNESVREKQFTPGDVISIGESQILVELDEGNGFSP